MHRETQRLLTIALVVVSILLLFSAASAETVHFRSATTSPTPLQQRLAKEHGQPIAEHPSEEIIGEFYHPPSKGPFPAVVSLHGCAGRGSRESEDAGGVGYVTAGHALLIVDSFGPRGVKERSDGAYGASVDRVMDAYGVLNYLAGLPFIDPDKIAVIGYSQGADIALSTVALGRDETLFDRHFRAAIAYYPWCDISAVAVIAPTLILIGALDDWTPARNCQEMMARRSGEGAPLRLVVYPGRPSRLQLDSPARQAGDLLRSPPRIQRGRLSRCSSRDSRGSTSGVWTIRRSRRQLAIDDARRHRNAHRCVQVSEGPWHRPVFEQQIFGMDVQRIAALKAEMILPDGAAVMRSRATCRRRFFSRRRESDDRLWKQVCAHSSRYPIAAT